MASRTYNLESKTIDWVDKFAEEQNVSKSDVVNRAIKAYSVKLDRGEWEDDYWGRDDIEEEFEGLVNEIEESVEIQLNDAWEEYPRIPTRKEHREFFPPYKEEFTLQTDIGPLKTWVSARSGEVKDTSTGGNYIRATIPKWAEEHPEVSGGDYVLVEKLSDGVYRLKEAENNDSV
jgi:uncharacterized protein YndB with AHSA1/START domain